MEGLNISRLEDMERESRHSQRDNMELSKETDTQNLNS